MPETRLTSYQLSCGYHERYPIRNLDTAVEKGCVSFWREHSTYHVRLTLYPARVWRSARTLREGRAILRALRGMARWLEGR